MHSWRAKRLGHKQCGNYLPCICWNAYDPAELLAFSRDLNFFAQETMRYKPIKIKITTHDYNSINHCKIIIQRLKYPQRVGIENLIKELLTFYQPE